MASNQLPYNCGALLNLGNLMVSGLSELGTSLGITQITTAQMQTAVTAFSLAETAYITARSQRASAYTTFKAENDTLGAWLSDARGVLTAIFGPTWSNAWLQAGFTNNSTAVPKGIVERITLVANLVNYFTANPGSQAVAQQVTAAKASEIHYAVTVAQLTVNATGVAMQTKKATRETACVALRKKMKLLITTLAALLARNDARWGTFGLNMPAANTTPGQPQNVVAASVGGGKIMVRCDAVPLATRYRWRVRIIGAETGYTLAASTTAPMAEIKKILPGQTVAIIVQAVNGGSQGVASEPVLVLVTAPAPETAAPLLQLPRSPETHPVSPTNGTNGNGTSHEHGAALSTSTLRL